MQPIHGAMLALWAIVLALLPFFIEGNGWFPHLFKHLAVDTAYYLRLAESFVDTGRTSFDGQTPTNGYNPLWQVLTILVRLALPSDADPLLFIAAITILGHVFLSAGSVIIALVLARAYGVLVASALLVLIVPGAFALIFEPLVALTTGGASEIGRGMTYGFSSWQFSNGMESSVGFLLFATLFMLILGPGFRDPSNSLLFVTGTLTFLVMMARLDDVFLGVAVFIVIVPALIASQRWSAIVAFASIPLVGTALYVSFNLWAYDIPLPTSGLSKTNLFSFSGLPLRLDHPSYAARLIPLLVLLFAGLFTLLAIKRGKYQQNKSAAILGLYLVLKYSFLVSSVPFFSQGYWYYSLGITAFNVLVVFAVAPRLAQLSRRLQTTCILAGAAFALFGALVNSNRLLASDPTYALSVTAHLCLNNQTIETELRRAARAEGIPYQGIELGDGAAAFCLDLPSISMTGLADSEEVRKERAEKGLFATAMDRGYSIILESQSSTAAYISTKKIRAYGYDLVQLYADEIISFHRLVAPDEQADQKFD